MVDKITSPLPEPEKATEESERAKLATMRMNRDGDGTWTTKGGHIRTDNSVNKSSKKRTADTSARSTSYSNLFGQSGLSDAPLWSDSMHGRVLIRLLSRGIFGALAFTWGQRTAKKQLQNYTPDAWDRTKPLQWIAKAVDSTVGKAIQTGAGLLADEETRNNPELMRKWKHDSTQFRYKAYYHDEVGHSVGRSLGAEVVGVTFDFAMASIADATMRNLIQAIDPNNRKPWIVDENGNPSTKGRFDFNKWTQSVGRAAWRIISKNQGEDWAAALPYVYQMKWQRQWIANHFPGFKVSADNSWNGASLKLDTEGNVIGDYHVPGAIDLQARFVGYNWYTLMYRETYDAIAENFNKWKEDGFKLAMPKISNPLTAIVDATGSAVRYTMKSFIKANIYMQPAVPFFWAFRVPQSKWRAGAVVDGLNDATNAIAAHLSPEQVLQKLAAGASPERYAQIMEGRLKQGLGTPGKPGDTRFLFDTTKFKYNLGHKYKNLFVGGVHKPNGNATDLTSVFSPDACTNWFSKVLNPLGKASYVTGSKAVDLAEKLPDGFIKDFLSVPSALGTDTNSARDNFVRTFVDASFSYTPYMIAKAETALRVDERPSGNELGEMDKAIYSLLDNTFTFNLKGAGKAVLDIAYMATHMKADAKSREGKSHSAEAPAAVEPKTTISTASLERTAPAALERANDNEHAANDHDDRGWAEAVTGQKLAARFHNAQRVTH